MPTTTRQVHGPQRLSVIPARLRPLRDRSGSDNRVVAADCDPGIVDLDHVASEPYGP